MAIQLSNNNTETGEGGCSCCRPYEKILQFKSDKLTDKDKACLLCLRMQGRQVISIGIGGFNQDMSVAGIKSSSPQVARD